MNYPNQSPQGPYPPQGPQPPQGPTPPGQYPYQPPPKDSSFAFKLLSGGLSFGSLSAIAIQALFEYTMVAKTMSMPHSNEGEEGCCWLFMSMPVVGFGHIVAVIAGVVSLVAFGVAIKARSIPLMIFAGLVICAAIGLSLASIYAWQTLTT